MEPEDIEAVVAGFAGAAKLAVDAGCDGVEINAGQHSLVRQFLSGLTNQRTDEWGSDRARFACDVLAAVRAAVGPTRVVGLRLSCDELAPWAGITPEQAPGLAASLVDGVDYLVVARGSIFSVEQTRPDFHQPAGFNVELAGLIAGVVDVPVIAQGSIVSVADAMSALEAGCAGVEMTRAQIADPDLVAKLRAGPPGAHPAVHPLQPDVPGARRPQPARDVHRRADVGAGDGGPGLDATGCGVTPGRRRRRWTCRLGDGAGGDAARASRHGRRAVITAGRARRRWPVRTARSSSGWPRRWSGSVWTCAPERSRCRRMPTSSCSAPGRRPGRPDHAVASDAVVLDVAALRLGSVTLPDEGDVVVLDPIGGPIGVALAEELGTRAVLVTQDHIAGNELARSGDLAPANVRLAQAGVRIERRTIPREVRAGEVVVEDRFTGERRTIPCAAVVDCGFRLPDDPLPGATMQAGDCVAPRTIHEAILEGRRAALSID